MNSTKLLTQTRLRLFSGTLSQLKLVSGEKNNMYVIQVILFL
jgi:hypothetical protein